jgi:hypothetical protein
MMVRERDGISFRIIISFYKLLFQSLKTIYKHLRNAKFTVVLNNLPTPSLTMGLYANSFGCDFSIQQHSS